MTQSDERARKAMAETLQRLRSERQAAIAAGIGVSESTLSRHISEGHLERSLRILCAVGMQVVDEGMKFLDERDVQVLMHGHRRWVEGMTISGLAKGAD